MVASYTPDLYGSRPERARTLLADAPGAYLMGERYGVQSHQQ
jgi:hypothetical protein